MSDAEHFRDLYEVCYPRVLAYAADQVGRQAGEDITSETFTVAWRRRKDLPSPPLPWLLGVARNLIREARRRDGRQRDLMGAAADAISAAGASGSVDDVAGGITERAAVLDALATLSDADRELLTLIAWHGLRPKEAAQVLGCTAATLTVRLHRARRRLERAVDATGLSREARLNPTAQGELR